MSEYDKCPKCGRKEQPNTLVCKCVPSERRAYARGLRDGAKNKHEPCDVEIKKQAEIVADNCYEGGNRSFIYGFELGAEWALYGLTETN